MVVGVWPLGLVRVWLQGVKFRLTTSETAPLINPTLHNKRQPAPARWRGLPSTQTGHTPPHSKANT